MKSKYKYEIAFDRVHNCTNNKGHCFGFIKDKQKIDEIKIEHPRYNNGIGLWECFFCGKITQSM